MRSLKIAAVLLTLAGLLPAQTPAPLPKAARPQHTAAQDEAAKRADVMRLMAMLDDQQIEALMDQMAKQLVEMLRPTIPAGDDNFYEELMAEMRKEFNASQIQQRLIPVYMKHLSHQDVKAMLAFYSSSAGKRIRAAMPSIVQEVVATNQQFSTEALDRILDRMRDKYPAMPHGDERGHPHEKNRDDRPKGNRSSD